MNLLLLYCKYSYYDLAADILAENAELTYKNMKRLGSVPWKVAFLDRPEDYEFLDALILGQSSPEEAYRRFDELSGKHVEMLRKGTKNIQDARRQRDQALVKNYLAEFDEALAKYIPVLMGQAKPLGSTPCPHLMFHQAHIKDLLGAGELLHGGEARQGT